MRCSKWCKVVLVAVVLVAVVFLFLWNQPEGQETFVDVVLLAMFLDSDSSMIKIEMVEDFPNVFVENLRERMKQIYEELTFVDDIAYNHAFMEKIFEYLDHEYNKKEFQFLIEKNDSSCNIFLFGEGGYPIKIPLYDFQPSRPPLVDNIQVKKPLVEIIPFFYDRRMIKWVGNHPTKKTIIRIK